jgi:predicted RNA-binding Zn-ribbon protein involved in translation (DUF1610 family)
MFFFIGGIQPKTILLEKQPILCPECGYREVYQKRVDQYISVFFIPLFPIKKGIPFFSCENCKHSLYGNGNGSQYWDSKNQKRCRSCGENLEQNFRFCPKCGKSMY